MFDEQLLKRCKYEKDEWILIRVIANSITIFQIQIQANGGFEQMQIQIRNATED